MPGYYAVPRGPRVVTTRRSARLVPTPIGRDPFNPETTRERTATASSPAGTIPANMRQPTEQVNVAPNPLEVLRTTRPDWYHLAECKGMTPELFFPERGNTARLVQQAQAVCAACPVIVQCRETSLYETHGVWGGLTETDRRQTRRWQATA